MTKVLYDSIIVEQAIKDLERLRRLVALADHIIDNAHTPLAKKHLWQLAKLETVPELPKGVLPYGQKGN